MRERVIGSPYVDPTSVVLTSPKENTVWLGDARRGIVTKIVGSTVFFQAIFDGQVDVRQFGKKEFCETYQHTPKVSSDTIREIHRRYAEAAGATAEARAALSAYNPPSQQENQDMAAKKPAAPKTAEKKPAAAKKAAPAPETSARGRKGAFDPSMKITILVEGNPKRAKAAERFALYKNGMTVATYLELGGLIADVRWDAKQEFIKVE